MSVIHLKLFPFVALALLGACGGTPTDGGGGDSRVIDANPLFAVDIQEIFTRRGCTASNCHGSSMQGALGLATASASFLDLVNVASTGNANIDRVKPNDAVNSYLVMTLEGDAGPRMPRGWPPWTTST